MKRVQHNLLARAERRLLDRLCAVMPRWVTPDRLSALGIGGAAMILVGYAASGGHRAMLWLAIAGYCVHWFGDSLDGSIARARQTERPRYGFFLDHSLDAISITAGMIGLGLTPFVRLDAALFTLVAYLLMTVHVLLRVAISGEMQLSFAGGGPTELRLTLIALTGSMLLFGNDLPGLAGLSFHDLCTLGMGLALSAIFLWQTAATAATLRRRGG
jgi:phosphatidylglycerophosphate synthase